MAFAVFMLAAVYVLFIVLLVAAGAGPISIAVTVAVVVLVHYFSCDRLALAALHARTVDAEQAPPELYAIVERLCVTAELPMVELALVETAMPNAFTVGRSPANTTVCVTTGLLSTLDEDELEAVLAHELTHLASRDVVVMTAASVFASVAAFIVRGGQRLGRGSRRRDEADSPMFLFVILAGLVYIVSYVVFQALSRYRELAADKGSAILTGRPQALCSALERISAQLDELTPRELHDACGELAAFYIVVPDLMATVATIFFTHPPLEDRLERLRRAAARLATTA
jgi:heat shock protein HtpX